MFQKLMVEMDVPARAETQTRDERRGWDSNPGDLARPAVFKTAPFGRSGTPPACAFSQRPTPGRGKPFRPQFADFSSYEGVTCSLAAARGRVSP